MARAKTIEALKEAYKVAVDECGLSGTDAALTREIGALITRFGAGQGAGILQTLAREAKPPKGGARSSRRPFIHPSLKKPELQAQALVSKPPASQKPPATLPQQPTATKPPAQTVQENPASQNLEEKPGHAVEVDAIPPAEWKVASVNTLAKYGRERIIATLNAAHLPFDPAYSERQLAKVLLDSLKPVGK